MTHDELLAKIDKDLNQLMLDEHRQEIQALRAVVELHKPREGSLSNTCSMCDHYGDYPCQTIQAITNQLL